MKKYILLIGSLYFIACQNGEENPTDLAGKKELLTQKKEALKTLQTEISSLQDEIKKLDPPKEKEPVLVSTRKLTPTTFTRYITIPGNVESDDLVNVTAEVPGRLKSIRAKEGDRVRKGQIIASLDMETVQLQINEIETALSLANTVYERQKRLWDQQIGSEIQYLQAKNNKERLEKNLETTKSQLAKQYIYAPITGIVDKEFLSSGELASPGMPIVNILDASKVKVVADVPETFLGKINRGDQVKIYFPALGDTITQKVSLLGRTIDPANRTFQIEINLNNRDNSLKPNLLAEVIFSDYRLENAIVAPVDYILEEVSGKKYVFLANDTSDQKTARKEYVELGESYDGEVVVTGGLNAGEIMITDGSRSVVANGPIKLNN